MPLQSRSLLLFFVLAAAALLTWVFARNTEQEPTMAKDNIGRAPQGYYLVGAVLYSTDDEGQIPYRVYAERVEQASRQHNFNLEEVRVEYAGESEIDWGFAAARGAMTPDRALLDLLSVRLTARRIDEADSLVFEARDLSLNLRDKTAGTRRPVSLREGQCETNARGLNVDLNADTFEMPDAVTICRRGARPVLALALLAGSAVAQDGPDSETFTAACYPVTGDLLNNVLTCKDAVITKGVSFRLTAGLATVDGQTTVRFEQSEWHLTEGVRLEFDTAVLVAESAVFLFDADGMLESFDLVGMPAELTDYIEGQLTPIRIRAQRIAYDRESATLTMPGEAQFLDDGDEDNAGSACDLTYWLEEKRFAAGSLQCGFNLSLAPVSAEDSNGDPPAEP